MKAYLFTALISLGLLACNRATAMEMPCSENDISAIRSTALSLASWEEVYNFYISYHDCADDTISENVSESIQRLWSERWSDIPQMISYANQNNKFKYFVWERISDDTFPQDEFDALVQNAKKNCPRVAAEFCLAVAREARRNLLPSARRNLSR
jgi:hypothetical protein